MNRKSMRGLLVALAAASLAGSLAQTAKADPSAGSSSASEAQPLVSSVIQALLKSTSAVMAYAKTPDDEKLVQDTSSLFFNVEVKEDLDTARGHSLAVAKAAREAVTKNKVDPTANVFFANGPPEGAAIAFAKANSLSEMSVKPPGLIPVKDLLALNIQLRSDSPSVFAVSLSNLPDTNYDKRLLDTVSSVRFFGTDPATKLLSGFDALGLSAATPITTYISILAYLEGTHLQVSATDYLGNTLLTASDFSVSTDGGTTTATYSGQISTDIMVQSDLAFFQNLEGYAATAALSVPEPSTYALGALGLVAVVIRCRAQSWRADQRTHGLGSRKPTPGSPHASA
jgi:hypothetical protein